MLTHFIIKHAQRKRNNFAVVSLPIFAAVMFVSFFALSQVSVKAVSCYSDTWIDDSNPNSGQVVGCGVTHSNYYDPYHDENVETTITSPNGRSSTAFGFDDGGYYKHPFNARTEAVLAWDWSDVDGSYTITSHHYSDCPITDFGNTIISKRIVLHAYQREEPK